MVNPPKFFYVLVVVASFLVMIGSGSWCAGMALNLFAIAMHILVNTAAKAVVKHVHDDLHDRQKTKAALREAASAGLITTNV